jgi:hypothetical protein
VVPPSRPVDLAGNRTEELLAEAGWYPLQDRILGRISHDLNGRAMFLETAVGWLEAGRNAPPSLGEEVARVWELAELLTLITSKPEAPPAAIGGNDLLRSVFRLHRLLQDRNADPGSPRIDEELPPVLVSEPRFIRSALLALDAARASPGGEPSIRVSGDADRLVVRASSEIRAEDGSTRAALERLLALDGAEIRSEDGDVVLELPSLTAARLRGR